MQQPWSFHNWAFMTVAQFGWPALWSRLSQLIWVLSQCLLMRGSLGKLSRHIFLKSNSFAVLFLKCGMEKILFHTLFLLAQSRRKYKVYFSHFSVNCFQLRVFLRRDTELQWGPASFEVHPLHRRRTIQTDLKSVPVVCMSARTHIATLIRIPAGCLSVSGCTHTYWSVDKPLKY